MKDNRVNGYRAAGLATGIKTNGEKDLGIIITETPATVAGVFTTNQIQAAPVLLDKKRVHSGRCRAIIVNSGVANCCTGEKGMNDAIVTTGKVADLLNVDASQVLVASTGVIGPRLPMDTIRKAIPGLVDAAHPGGFNDFAQAIMTTDTVPKLAFRKGKVGGRTFRILGVAKGAGMIHPNMATMLAFICTDLAIASEDLHAILKSGVDDTFNCMSIDGDTSTNDTVLLLANGCSQATIETPYDFNDVKWAVNDVMASLARQLVKDGEGATKLVTLNVIGANTEEAAKAIASTVGQSSLVKTAIFGEDANWGRLVAAVGRAGVPIRPDHLRIYFDDALVFINGQGIDGPDGTRADAVLRQDEYVITIDLGMGKKSAKLLTCDLSVNYVNINADYRT